MCVCLFFDVGDDGMWCIGVVGLRDMDSPVEGLQGMEQKTTTSSDTHTDTGTEEKWRGNPGVERFQVLAINEFDSHRYGVCVYIYLYMCSMCFYVIQLLFCNALDGYGFELYCVELLFVYVFTYLWDCLVAWLVCTASVCLS